MFVLRKLQTLYFGGLSKQISGFSRHREHTWKEEPYKLHALTKDRAQPITWLFCKREDLRLILIIQWKIPGVVVVCLYFPAGEDPWGFLTNHSGLSSELQEKVNPKQEEATWVPITGEIWICKKKCWEESPPLGWSSCSQTIKLISKVPIHNSLKRSYFYNPQTVLHWLGVYW